MLNADQRRELVGEAERLVNRLRKTGAGRAELSDVANVLVQDRTPWPERVEKARRIAELLPRSWKKERSGSTPERLRTVREVFLDLLGRHEDEEEVRYLLGWTMRLLHVRELEEGKGGGGERKERMR